MGLLWGKNKKTCFECGMEIPYMAKICPYCHSKQKDNILNDVEGLGCLGYPLFLIIILGLIILIASSL